jgi:Zn-dependent protease/predicted transcriptional regulator
MFGKPYRLFSVLGFSVGVDPSWFILLFLITWSLALGLFPARFPDLSAPTYWIMGLAGAMGLFFSILVHELSHSLVARRFGLHMRGITLFMFGGVAEMPEEPSRAKTEFWMALAGPLTSLGLALFFYCVYRGGAALEWPVFWDGLIGYLALVNVFLAAFNLLPAFPLDGGRVLRAAVWGFTRDFARATRIAAATGSGFGLLFMAAGAARVLSGNVIGGVWWMLIGMFVRSGARASARQMEVTRVLSRERAADVMNPSPVTVDPEITVRRFVDEFLYKHDVGSFPVTEKGRLVGCIGLNEVKAVAQERWDARSVGDVMMPCEDRAIVAPDYPAEKAMARLQEGGLQRLLVVEDGYLRGAVTTRDLLHHLSVKLEMEKPVASGPRAGARPRAA